MTQPHKCPTCSQRIRDDGSGLERELSEHLAKQRDAAFAEVAALKQKYEPKNEHQALHLGSAYKPWRY